MRKTFFFLIVLAVLSSCSKKVTQNTGTNDRDLQILTKANSWVWKQPDKTKKIITGNGIENWSDAALKIRTYFKVETPGEIRIGIHGKTDGNSKISMVFNGKSKTLRLKGASFKDYDAGTFRIKDSGYYFAELQGIEKTGRTFAEIDRILLSGTATKGKLYFIKNDIYWGRRGPSVHLTYQIPEKAGEIEWFYNELKVDKGQDVVGSYFMANGFAEGYFGIQVNSDTLRTVLFSVWSPYKTDDLKSIPMDQRIVLLKKGADVLTAEFGNEGSGGQSRFLYNWKAGNTYKFLTRIKPAGKNFTDYTCYFYAPEKGKWKLIASFRRPKTDTYLKRPHSFLENFIPETGDQSRMVTYANQWVRSKNGNWFELTKARFTADATAKKEARMDYAGGISGNRFFLKNCGFFNETTPIGTVFERTPARTPPQIDLNTLPE